MPPVVWNEGPWSTARPAPYKNVASQGTSAARQPYQGLMDQGEGGASGGPSGPVGTGFSGPVGPGMGQALGAMGMGKSVAGLTSGLLGASVPGLGLASPLTPLAMVNIASSLAKRAGVDPAYDVFSTVPSLTDIQSVRDIMGEIEGMDRQQQRNQSLADYNANVSFGPETPRGFADPAQVGPTPGGFIGGVAPTPSVVNADMPSDSGGGAPGDSGYGGEMGGGMSEGGGAEARGGVKKTKPGKPQRSVYGERGPEKAIFIPEKGSQFDMTKPGIQGNERQVRSGIKSAYRSLMPRGGR